MKPTLFALALLLPLSVQAATDIQRWRNRDGTQILLVERHENPIIDLEVSFKGAGSVANPDGKSQVAEFTAALLTDGTQELDEEAFNAEADNIGAHISRCIQWWDLPCWWELPCWWVVLVGSWSVMGPVRGWLGASPKERGAWSGLVYMACPCLLGEGVFLPLPR